MRYFGGKARIANQLSEIINPMAARFEYYVEPFVGGANVLCKVKHPRRVASDANKALISLYIALQNGWEPPSFLDEKEYQRLKAEQNLDDPLTAFAAFGCSFAGKWFGGYARCANNNNYAQMCKNALFKKAKHFTDVKFIHSSYLDLIVFPNSFIYCDPPYANTTGYDGVKETFNSEKFWNWCRNQANNGNCVMVSEYSAPADFVSILTINTKTDIRDKTGQKSERQEQLFMYAGR